MGKEIDKTFMTIYKNTLTRRALKKLQLDCPKELTLGPSAMINSCDDQVKTAKAVVDFEKDNEELVIKGGFLDNKVVDIDVIKSLSKLCANKERTFTLF